MRKVWAVIRREFLERVRRKWFWVSALLGPIFFAAVFLLPVVFASAGGTKRIAVVDGTNADFGARVIAALNAGTTLRGVLVSAGTSVLDSLMGEVGAKRLDGVLILSEDVVATGVAEYRASRTCRRCAISRSSRPYCRAWSRRPGSSVRVSIRTS